MNHHAGPNFAHKKTRQTPNGFGVYRTATGRNILLFATPNPCLIVVFFLVFLRKVNSNAIPRERYPETYIEVKDHIPDSLERMAVHCDTAPVRLIMGEVEVIVSNLDCSEKPTASGV